MKSYLYPRDKQTGSIPEYVAPQFIGDDGRYEWLEPGPIEVPTLHFQGFERGRSAAHAVFATAEPNRLISRFTVFLTDLGKLLLTGELQGPIWKPRRGVVMPCKRGSNFGIRPLTDKELVAISATLKDS